MAKLSQAMMKVTKGKTSLIFDQPFWGVLALRLLWVESTKLPTAGTDGKQVFCNPTFIDSLPFKQLLTLLAHEIVHCMFGHHLRRGNRDHWLWNIACDYAINPLLLDAGFESIPGWLFREDFKGMSADKIYDILLQEYQKSKQQSKQQKGDGVAGDVMFPDLKPLDEIQDATNEEGNEISDAEREQLEHEWKIATAQAATMANNSGKLPGFMKRIIDELLNPKLPWRDLLRQFLEVNTYDDYVFLPPNKKYVQAGFYLPSCRSRELGDFILGVDTSGSVDRVALNQVAAELQLLMDEFKANMTVIHCDDAVHEPIQEFFPGDDVNIEPIGGGGTSYRPVFSKIEELGLNPKFLIYFTDLECDRYPEFPPSYPVLWVCWRERYEQPPFGEVIKL